MEEVIEKILGLRLGCISSTYLLPAKISEHLLSRRSRWYLLLLLINLDLI
jgi:hypothetical protein